MTEFEKMRNQQLYNYSDAEIDNSITHAQKTASKFNLLTLDSPMYKETLHELLPNAPESTTICPPFHCDHGHGIIFGENVFINYNCTFLDGGKITLGNNVKIGPCVQIYTPQHPFDHIERRKPIETSFPVTIEDDVWIGGNATILPGVTIGARSIIGAGSVVTKDIPSDCIAAGNPCKIIKRLQ
ncbi:MAG: sugar O-acetyltransferase [Bacteroidales bacterium]|nr:sugar O-acetyltransferase [Bacteroidales bacterium]